VKILFTRFPLESAHSGAEAQSIALMKGLKEHGHAVAFLGSCPTLLVLCQQHNIACASLDIGPPPVSKKTLLTFPLRKYKMQKDLTGALDQFCSHGLGALFMLSLSEKLLLTKPAVDAGIRVFWVEHDSIGPWLTKNPYLPQLRRLSKLVTTIAVSDLSRKLYVDLGWDPQKVVGIPNGIDPNRFVTDAAQTRTPSEKLQVGCLARLADEKGLDVLIGAVRDLPDVELKIVGLGREQKNLEKLIAKEGLQNRVTIAPRVADVGAFYRSLNVHVLPSKRHDPFGLVAAEAMLAGTPVIVTDACGIADFLTHKKDAYIVPANSEEALTKAISELSSNPELRKEIGAAGQRKAQSDFTVQGMIDRYEVLLQR